MAKDLFNSPFDDGTKKKLEIFREYLKSWLPTFTKGKKIYWNNIFIYDFFSGEGKDKRGVSGSPLVILEELKDHHKAIKSNNLKLKVILNEKVKSRYLTLRKNISTFQENAPYEISTENKDFKEFFDEIYSTMLKKKDLPRLIFLDQNGIKQITQNVFRKLTDLKRTDFLFFISSSYIRRFTEVPEFSEYIKITKNKFDQTRPYHSHRIVFDYYKSLIKNKEYYLAPFSIKKGTNIYGLIFGSNHLLGIEKFLRIAWRLNEHSGDANFNIDEEAILETQQMSIFEEENKPKKLTLFEKNLKNLILEGNLRSNLDVYKYSFDQGCLPKHANKIISALIKENIINPIKTANQNIHKLEENIITLKV